MHHCNIVCVQVSNVRNGTERKSIYGLFLLASFTTFMYVHLIYRTHFAFILNKFYFKCVYLVNVNTCAC